MQALLDAVAGKSSNKFVLENEALNAKKKDYKGSGTVFVERFSIQKNYSFLDYIKVSEREGDVDFLVSHEDLFAGRMSNQLDYMH